MRNLLLFLSFTFLANTMDAQNLTNPSFEEVLSLPSVSTLAISPSGEHVVFQKQATDWKDNKYASELWLSKNGAEPFPLTHNPGGSSTSPQWSPDGKWIAFLSKRGDKTQIHALRIDGGESFPLTNTNQNISSFEWSPDGKQIAFLQSEDKEEADKKRKEKYGAFAVEDKEYKVRQLWITDFDPFQSITYPLPKPAKEEDKESEKKDEKAQLLIDTTDFTINGFLWSPDAKKIAFEHQPDPLINSFFKADISVYDVESRTHKVLVSNPSYDGLIDWSPDSKSILYQSNLDNSTSNYYTNDNFFRINLDGSGNQALAEEFDENIYRLNWTDQGILGVAWQRTKRKLVKIDPGSGNAELLELGPDRIIALSCSKDGKKIAFTGREDEKLTEVYMGDLESNSATAITDETSQIQDWAFAASEVITWKSEDGAEIEGVLHKPKDFVPNKKYPLMVIIHGGPTGISYPEPTPSYVYPMLQWLNKGALILRPNYRGSAGYGEKFRALNVKNLGVGDAWDVLSGVKYLEEQGIVDSDKLGCMGWSQGGYISAFLTTNSDKFKAVSVGAGISNWMTYYVNTDIHPFTRQYLKATPWSDKEIYEKTSPMTNINNASTPTLIQHGEFDKRVPIANAFELFQGLQDVGVETQLVVYKGFGHGITKPKERLAAMWHNWQWFGKYIWGEEISLPEE